MIISVTSYLTRLMSWQSSTRSRIPDKITSSGSTFMDFRLGKIKIQMSCHLDSTFRQCFRWVNSLQGQNLHFVAKACNSIGRWDGRNIRSNLQTTQFRIVLRNYRQSRQGNKCFFEKKSQKFSALATTTSPEVSRRRLYFPSSSPLREMSVTHGGPLTTSRNCKAIRVRVATWA